jgi:hypothetical protein
LFNLNKRKKKKKEKKKYKFKNKKIPSNKNKILLDKILKCVNILIFLDICVISTINHEWVPLSVHIWGDYHFYGSHQNTLFPSLFDCKPNGGK